MIQLSDPASEHEASRDAIEAAALRVLRSGQYILGSEVDEFEREFARYCGAGVAVGVSNGSDAIVVALQGLDIGPGDEVITSAFSYFATSSAISRTGANQTFADIDIDTFNIDPDKVIEQITSKTKAILAVHLFGRVVDTDRLGEIARHHGIALIEDAAQASGGERHGIRTGSLGRVACFSFFPAKPFGADGDGGACVTNDEALASTMKKVRLTGATAKNIHDLPGGNYRLDPLQAAILRAKLPSLETRLARRRANAARIRDGIDGISSRLSVPQEDPDGRHVYAQFTIRHPARDALVVALRARAVNAEIYYPVPMPYQKVLASLGHRPGEFPRSEQACREVLSIPTHSELSSADVDHIVSAVRDGLREIET